SDIQVDESRKLGEGGFGTVHVGLLRGSVPVAVKRIKGGMDESTLRSFRKEVQAWTGLVQRNVLPLMAVCLDPPMMVTDLVECGNLRQFLSQRDWDVRIALALLLDVSHGMAYIHSEGIVHGDLKPQNILVDRGNRAMVTDFGLARLQRETTTTATPGTHAPGTLAYLAPEVLGGSRPRKPADVYSFAMTAYEALGGGCKPFAGIPTEAVAFQVLANRRPARLHELTQDAWALCEDCWTHAAKERPTFAELVPRLASLQDRQAGP
ncbi:kinase-like domain-containing protein, partial [Hyaloraphidium curvatum]